MVKDAEAHATSATEEAAAGDVKRWSGQDLSVDLLRHRRDQAAAGDVKRWNGQGFPRISCFWVRLYAAAGDVKRWNGQDGSFYWCRFHSISLRQRVM